MKYSPLIIPVFVFTLLSIVFLIIAYRNYETNIYAEVTPYNYNQLASGEIKK